ncbi:MAG: hypothetical protein K8W52_39740 [Deltaproteobacteria bacterium]|nr:hypothetical protein [Deltaproteobacteria bacterium]
MADRFRFRPRFRGVAWSAIAVGALIAGFAAIAGAGITPIAIGLTGVVFGGAYLASPTWRIAVVVDDDGLAVTGAGARSFRVAWPEIAKVTASPTTRTCHVDGGAPARSLIVPGVGAIAPYAIERSGDLYDAIVARVDRARIAEVATLDGEAPVA